MEIERVWRKNWQTTRERTTVEIFPGYVLTSCCGDYKENNFENYGKSLKKNSLRISSAAE